MVTDVTPEKVWLLDSFARLTVTSPLPAFCVTVTESLAIEVALPSTKSVPSSCSNMPTSGAETRLFLLTATTSL